MYITSGLTDDATYLNILRCPEIREINHLLSQPESITIRDYRGRTPLMCLSWNGFHPEALEKVISIYSSWEAKRIGVKTRTHIDMIKRVYAETSLEHPLVP